MNLDRPSHVNTLIQDRRELGGGTGQIIFVKKKFSDNNNPLPPSTTFQEKNFPHKYVIIAFQRLYLNFSYQIAVLFPKKPQISCPLRGNISPKKAQQKISSGQFAPPPLHFQRARGNPPPPLHFQSAPGNPPPPSPPLGSVSNKETCESWISPLPCVFFFNADTPYLLWLQQTDTEHMKCLDIQRDVCYYVLLLRPWCDVEVLVCRL